MTDTVLITGITGGLGQAMVSKFLDEKEKVCGTYAHEGKRVEEFRSKFPKVNLFKIDHSKLNDIKELYKEIFDLEKPNILINNAGITHDDFIVNLEKKEFMDVVKVNLISAWIISENFIQLYNNTQQYSKIINLSSISGMIGRETQTAYALTKGGLMGLTQLLEHESNNSNFSSLCVLPGLIETSIMEHIDKRKVENFKENTLAKRLGNPNEVANFIYMLSKSDISYCNGGCYSIDGGVLK